MIAHVPERARERGQMSNDGNRTVVEGFFNSVMRQDYASARAFVAHDVVFDWPQTNERVLGIDNVLEINRRYPGGLPQMTARRVTGVEDHWVVDATFTPRRISGSGDVWIGEADFRYADGSDWAYCEIIELRDGRVAHLTEYWAARSEAPAW